MKIGDLVRQSNKDYTVPIGALGLVVDRDDSQKTTPRWTIWWFSNNLLWENHKVSETTGYGYGVEVISV